jgi:amidohydrolase/hippurate hydrolase
MEPINGGQSMTHELLKRAKELEGWMTSMRRAIHRDPELGMQEYHTTELVKAELEKIGVKMKDIGLETGVLGLIEGTGEGPVTGLRADMDALPLIERTGRDYASQNKGVMHACGHDGHTAILLGTAKILNEMKNRFKGLVKLIFQPAEEGLGGAAKMVKAGVLKDPKVTTVIALHGWPFLEVGKIGVCDGPFTASADKFSITVHGRGGHGGYPHRAVDPVLAACHLVAALQQVASRQIDPVDNIVVSVCKINGGTTNNVIPETVGIAGTVRCHEDSVRSTIEERIRKIADGVCSGFGCTCALEYGYGTPRVVNDAQVMDLVARAAADVLGEGAVEELRPTMGAEDFSRLVNEAGKGGFFRLGLGVPGREPVSLHNDRFDFNDAALPVGAAMFARIILSIQGNGEKIEQNRRQGNATGKSPREKAACRENL